MRIASHLHAAQASPYSSAATAKLQQESFLSLLNAQQAASRVRLNAHYYADDAHESEIAAQDSRDTRANGEAASASGAASQPVLMRTTAGASSNATMQTASAPGNAAIDADESDNSKIAPAGDSGNTSKANNQAVNTAGDTSSATSANVLVPAFVLSPSTPAAAATQTSLQQLAAGGAMAQTAATAAHNAGVLADSATQLRSSADAHPVQDSAERAAGQASDQTAKDALTATPVARATATAGATDQSTNSQSAQNQAASATPLSAGAIHLNTMTNQIANAITASVPGHASSGTLDASSAYAAKPGATSGTAISPVVSSTASGAGNSGAGASGTGASGAGTSGSGAGSTSAQASSTQAAASAPTAMQAALSAALQQGPAQTSVMQTSASNAPAGAAPTQGQQLAAAQEAATNAATNQDLQTRVSSRADSASASGINTSGINAANLVQAIGSSAMRVGMHSAEFGDISIQTTVANKQMVAQISLDHGDLSQAIAAHVSALQQKLGSDHGMQASIHVNDLGSSLGSSTGSGGSATGSGVSSGAGQSSAQNQSANTSSMRTSSQASQADAVIAMPAAYAAGDSIRLDIRA